MAWATGMATDHIDLLAKLVTFLTTNSALVAASQNWTALRAPVALPFTAAVPNGRISFGNNIFTDTMADAWPTGVANANTRVKVTGTLIIPATGTYAFVTSHSEWLEVRIDGALVYGSYASNYVSTYASSAQFSVPLTAGNHTIDVQLVQSSGSSQRGVALGWKKPSDSVFATIPTASYSGLTLAWSLTYGGGTGSATAFANIMKDTETVVRGPGLAGTDQIFVSLYTLSNTSADIFNIAIDGAVAYLPNNSVKSQPGASNTMSGMLGWNSSIKYWFIANGRRFIVISKVSTVYECLHGGFLLPYGLPTEIPYPLTIGGSTSDLQIRFSDTSTSHRSFWRPQSYTNGLLDGNLKYRDNAGNWLTFDNLGSNSIAYGRVYPTASNTPVDQRSSPDGSYALTPLVLFNISAGPSVIGEIDGAFNISGFSNASENVVNIASQDYLVVQSGFRTTSADYAAIKLS